MAGPVKRSPLVAAVRRALRALPGPLEGRLVLAGLSGGADSVALLDVLQTLGGEMGFRLAAGHLDHGLRDGSSGDAAFCAALCADRGLPFRAATSDVRARAARDRGGLEQAARAERHAFLLRLKQELGADWVALAHTRDDQVETLLLRLLRGSGRTGLAAMRPVRGPFVRPLLEVTRAEVEAHLRGRAIAWREDPSNADPAFLRNRVRHELLPYLRRRFNPSVDTALARTAALVADEADVLADASSAVWAKAAREDAAGVVLARPALAEAAPALARMVVRRALAREHQGLTGVRRVHVDRIVGLAAPRAAGRVIALPGAREARVVRGGIRVGPRATGETTERPHRQNVVPAVQKETAR